MIEDAIRWRAVRRSKIAFWVVGSTVGLTTAVIGSAITAWPRAVLYGFAAGLLVGFTVGLSLFCWPAIRVIWHWSAELALFGTLLTTYLWATTLLPYWAALALLTVAFGGPFLIPPLRRRVWPCVLCAITRHRLRVCFAAFIASQRSGMGPLILLARPIPAGERVWVWLRPGLALADLEQRLDKLATGCWAAECRIAPASRRYAALVRIDIARRNPLIGLIGSDLPDRVPHTVDHRSMRVEPSAITGLDLPDVPEPALPPAQPDTKRRKTAAAATSTPALTAAPANSTDLDNPPAQPVEDDLSLWI
jgi:hypothetical protein